MRALPQLNADVIPAGQVGGGGEPFDVGGRQHRLAIGFRELGEGASPGPPSERPAPAIECVGDRHGSNSVPAGHAPILRPGALSRE